MQDQRITKLGYGYSVGLSALMHIVLILFLLFSINMESGGSKANIQKSEIVNAAVIDEKAVQQEVARLEKIELDQKTAAAKKEQLYAQKLEEAKTARLQEQAKLMQLKKEMQKAQKEEETRLAEIKLAKEKEHKELEALKQKKEKELAAVQQKEQEKAAAAEVAAAAKAKAEVAAAAKAKAEAAAAAKAKATETAAANAQKAKWLASEEEKSWILFKDKVNQSWIRAPGLPTGLRCKLDIRLLPDGSVMAVQVLNSSGNVAFDQSALAAVEKSAPLPVPQDPALIEKFRHFTFEFNPDEHQTGVIFN